MFSVTFNPCMLSVIMLNAVMLNVVMLSVVAPYVMDSDKQMSLTRQGTNGSHKKFYMTGTRMWVFRVKVESERYENVLRETYD
jgi:hypothetical protein